MSMTLINFFLQSSSTGSVSLLTRCQVLSQAIWLSKLVGWTSSVQGVAGQDLAFTVDQLAVRLATDARFLLGDIEECIDGQLRQRLSTSTLRTDCLNFALLNQAASTSQVLMILLHLAKDCLNECEWLLVRRISFSFHFGNDSGEMR
ncbi:unnamed protein product [Protopolystoma xenopodis]|uniref:Uncharacterized protein n=1 Tax=Protopolystoma xenopodis TaxID=117903 RepID=A0A448WMG6_9PLAT|nr:unnamed protein product [Protopolystoma xenopodis]